MEEAQRCNKIAFLSKGVIVAEGSPKEVENSLDDFNIYKNTQDFDFELVKHLRENQNVHLVNQFGDELRIIVKKEFSKESLAAFMHEYMSEDVVLEVTNANLEDVFIALTQEAS